MLPLPFTGPAYAVPFWAAFSLWLLFEGRSWLAKRAKGVAAERRDHGSLALLGLLGWSGVLGDFACAFRLPEAALPWARPEIYALGVLMMLAGIALRGYAMALLGRYFTYDVAVQNDQPVIETGPYRYVRHPSYSGALLTFVGLALALGNWAGLALLVSCVSVAYSYRITVEEAELVAAFGDPYRHYMRRTWRLVPFLF